MSQYHYMLVHKGIATEVFMGWDRPLQGFFLVIDQGSDEPLWSNLYQEESHPETLEPFINELHSRGIELPLAMIEELEQDRLDNVGNKCVVYWGNNGEKRDVCTENEPFESLCIRFFNDDRNDNDTGLSSNSGNGEAYNIPEQQLDKVNNASNKQVYIVGEYFKKNDFTVEQIQQNIQQLVGKSYRFDVNKKYYESILSPENTYFKILNSEIVEAENYSGTLVKCKIEINGQFYELIAQSKFDSGEQLFISIEHGIIKVNDIDDNDCPACPFNCGNYKSDYAFNMGCLPSVSEIIDIKLKTNENWSCHSDTNKICKGFAQYCKENNMDYKSGPLTNGKYL